MFDREDIAGYYADDIGDNYQDFDWDGRNNKLYSMFMR